MGDDERLLISGELRPPAPTTPFGGDEQSGIGREMGVAGFEVFLELETLATPVT
jgi:acyl-CoA reductase-like NAD-dependent aldehyde dehydrogenase